MSRASREVNDRLMDSITIQHGVMQDVACNLYSIVNNERYFMPAFFSYYRALGVQQFLMLDDGSSDGTMEFLKDQPGCVILQSTYSYGDQIYISEDKSVTKKMRAGVLLKNAIPQKYFSGKFAIYADADEFLVLPSGCLNLLQLLSQLDELNISSVAASLVEFYPESIAELRSQTAPNSFEDLIQQSPYFDAQLLFDLQAGCQPEKITSSVSNRLFKTYQIKAIRQKHRRFPSWIGMMFSRDVFDASVFKTPIIKYADGVGMVGSHKANIPPPLDVCLTFAHFKFTSDFSRRMEQAVQKKSHAQGSEKYISYDRLLRAMAQSEGSFLGDHSRRYESSSCLEEAGLIKWNVEERLMK